MARGKAKDEIDNANVVDAMPTKALFIDMITRDIDYIPAIVDLIDNCVDGAQRLRGRGRFDGLTVEVDVSPQKLRIEDNCGGIAVLTARKYAFRFGRPLDAPSVEHSIGLFGVGMKRAFFKLGSAFRVESKSERDRFVLDVDVKAWAAKKEWTFEFHEMQEGTQDFPEEKRETIVEVTGLHADVVREFERPFFVNALEGEICFRLQKAIHNGLAITLNDTPVQVIPLVFLDDKRVAPATKTVVYRKAGRPVTVKLTCGLGPAGDPEMAGWHVFCNQRLVLKADKSPITGWGGEPPGTKLPFFHGQYNAFRGCVLFDSADAGLLPWNTSKTGVDVGSVVYRATRLKMVSMMRPVIDFLNRLKEEKGDREEAGEDEPGPLETIVAEAKESPADKVRTRDVFTMPRVKKPKPRAEGEKTQHIQYGKPKEKVDRVKKSLGARSLTDVGRRTFDYFYDAECSE